MCYPPVRGDNPRALASGLSYVQVDKHGMTILYHLHQCRPCTSRDICAKVGKSSINCKTKGFLHGIGLTWESVHAWNLIIVCLSLTWYGFYIYAHLSCYAISLLIYDAMYDITTSP